MMVLLVTIGLAGCDQSAAEIAQEIDAAREGCTQEELTAGAEECVQMFEKYMEMGTEAIQTYVGAAQAFDKALERRPEVPFDTAGIGHAISPRLTDGDTLPPTGDSYAPRRDQPAYFDSRSDLDGPAGARRGELPPAPRYTVPDGVAGDVYRRDPAVDESFGGPSRQPIDPPTRQGESSGRRSALPRRQLPPESPRGVLLPPEERLRRPWISDGAPPRQYTPPDTDAGAGRRPAAVPEPDGPPDPYAYPPPYPDSPW